MPIVSKHWNRTWRRKDHNVEVHKDIGIKTVVKKIHVDAADITTEKDSGWDIPDKAVVRDVYIDVITAQSGKTLNVGLLASESGGDADGFLAGVSLAAQGIVRGVATVTVGGTESYFASTTRGALLGYLLAGTNTAGDVGTCYEKPHVAGSVTAKSVSYTGSSGTTTAVFDIYVVYEDLT